MICTHYSCKIRYCNSQMMQFVIPCTSQQCNFCSQRWKWSLEFWEQGLGLDHLINRRECFEKNSHFPSTQTWEGCKKRATNYELLFCINCNVLLERQCIETEKNNALFVIKHFGFVPGSLLARGVWMDSLASRVRLALSVGEKMLKFWSIFYVFGESGRIFYCLSVWLFKNSLYYSFVSKCYAGWSFGNSFCKDCIPVTAKDSRTWHFRGCIRTT